MGGTVAEISMMDYAICMVAVEFSPVSQFRRKKGKKLETEVWIASGICGNVSFWIVFNVQN